MPKIKSLSNPTSAFRLKGSLLTLTVLQLLQSDSDAFTAQMEQLVTDTPNFFRNAPIVIDLENLKESPDTIDFPRIKSELIKHGIIPVGIRNGNEQQIQFALRAGLGMLNGKTEPHKQPLLKEHKNNTSKLIRQHVRSGQQIYAEGGDLIILGSVSPGAELIADGNIHVYGTLRGRVLAGVNGNTQANIFCLKLEAELISIAGVYKLIDDIEAPAGAQGAHIFLADEKLQIQGI